ncbi:isochorismate pyruvate lyase [Rhizobium sp. NFR07]|uniref:chorismate mutase n=1 Tax=Rhizobium sp. NFR07 TaxID=1566262 RepID=UPI0008E7189D|nr:chorismate mutase [Rhizobium sp. NFR07]SFB61548.1 isochorismate pyruvate lyase [Rhizobium sp. NFR07]
MLEQIRGEIDRLDEQLVELLAKRRMLVHAAGMAKTQLSEVDAPTRVERVIDRVRTLADGFGLEPRVAEATFRAMIREFIEVERELFVRKASNSEQ